MGGWVAAVTCSQRAVAAAPVTLACKAMSQDRFLALAVVSTDQLINFSTFVRRMLFLTVRIKELSYLVRRLVSPILEEKSIC